MAARLKSWESPRRQGRNDKGKGGSARRRQLKKQQQMLRNKLKAHTKANQAKEGRDVESLPSFYLSSLLRRYPAGIRFAARIMRKARFRIVPSKDT